MRIFLVMVIGIIISSLIFWQSLEMIISSDYPSAIKNEDWVGAISGYFGAVLGGIISFVGISWQLRHTEKMRVNEQKDIEEKRINGLKNNILRKIEYNLNMEWLESNLIESEKLLSYQSSIIKLGDNNKYLEEFNSKYIENNIDDIYSLKNGLGSKIIELDSELAKFNKLFNQVSNNINIKRKMLNELQTEYKEKEHLYYETMTSIAKELSNILYSYQTNGIKDYNIDRLDLIILEAKEKNPKFTIENSYYLNVKDKLNEMKLVKPDELVFQEKLKNQTELGKVLIGFMQSEFYQRFFSEFHDGVEDDIYLGKVKKYINF